MPVWADFGQVESKMKRRERDGRGIDILLSSRENEVRMEV